MAFISFEELIGYGGREANAALGFSGWFFRGQSFHANVTSLFYSLDRII